MVERWGPISEERKRLMIGLRSSCLRRLRTMTAALVVFGVMACEEPQPPWACGAIQQVTVNAGETSTPTACFNDPNGDMLTYSATSTNPGVATASISGTTVNVSGVAPGNASVVVTATDPGGLQGQWSIQVTVPNRAPLPRGTIHAMTISADERETVDASSYFTEPDGEALAYGAASSNPAAATVSVTGSTVTVTAIARGTTTVTVTATDPGGLAATQTFEATSNFPPDPVGTILDQTLTRGDVATIDASQYFTDPDGDVLRIYAAVSSNTGVARVSVSGAVVTIRAVAGGGATITVIAQDPDGLTAAQRANVTVTGNGAGFREDFHSSASLNDWTFQGAIPVVDSGMLELTAKYHRVLAWQDVTPVLTSWTIEARMGRERTDSSWVGLRWRTGHARYPLADFIIGGGDYFAEAKDSNYSLWLWDAGTQQWVDPLFGYTSAINDGAGELTTIRLSFIDGRLEAVVGGNTQLSLNDMTDQVGYEVFRHVSQVHLMGESVRRGIIVLFDWMDLNGFPIPASGDRRTSPGSTHSALVKVRGRLPSTPRSASRPTEPRRGP